MTFSIVARDQRSRQLGVAAVTGTPGVGQLLAWAKANCGAVATQGWVNPYIGIDALAMLGVGHPAPKTLDAVIALDDDRDLRQAGIVDAQGRSANFTGASCAEVAGARSGDGWSVQGNLLESADVIEACARTFFDSDETDLVQRLIAAVEAGEEAGGDKRGARSAAVYVVAAEDYPLWDLRVDDHEAPIEELHRLVERFADTLLPQILKLPTRRDSHGQLTDEDDDGLV